MDDRRAEAAAVSAMASASQHSTMRAISHLIARSVRAGPNQLSDVAVRLTSKGKPRMRNPAPEAPVVVRLQPLELDLLDRWMVEQDDIPDTRQDAIRRLIALVCGKMKGK